MRLKLTVVSHLVSTDTQNYFWHSLLMYTDMSFFQSQRGGIGLLIWIRVTGYTVATTGAIFGECNLPKEGISS